MALILYYTYIKYNQWGNWVKVHGTILFLQLPMNLSLFQNKIFVKGHQSPKQVLRIKNTTAEIK